MGPSLRFPGEWVLRKNANTYLIRSAKERSCAPLFSAILKKSWWVSKFSPSRKGLIWLLNLCWVLHKKYIHSESVKNSDGWNGSCMDRPALESQWNVVSHIGKLKPLTRYRRRFTNRNPDCIAFKNMANKFVRKTENSSVPYWILSASRSVTW